MPDYELLLDHYNAFRTGCGLVKLTDWSSVTLTGADRQSFLNNFSTNDVKRLTPGASCEAFLTNVKGKILGHVLVTCRDEELVMVTVPGQAPALIEHLDRYLIREDVQLRDTTAERAYLLLAGGNLAGGLVLAMGSNIAEGQSLLESLINATVTLAGVHGRWMQWDMLSSQVCGLLELTPAESPRMLEALSERLGSLGSDAGFHAARIASGMPLFGLDFDDTNFPQEVGRDAQAISFTKGCYLGQETVARIDALGHVNQRLVGVRFPAGDVPAHGTQLSHDGRPAGHVGSAAYSPQLGVPLALAMVRRESTAPGSRLESPLGSCEVVALPLGSS